MQSEENHEGQSLRELSDQNKKTVDEATKMLVEQQREAHWQAVLQWNLKRRERKQLEKDLLNYQVSTVQGGCPTDWKIKQARFHIVSEHMKRLREELPYVKRYFETIPMEMETEDSDDLSESSVGSYEACEEWNEEGYRKLLINNNRNQAQ